MILGPTTLAGNRCPSLLFQSATAFFHSRKDSPESAWKDGGCEFGILGEPPNDRKVLVSGAATAAVSSAAFGVEARATGSDPSASPAGCPASYHSAE
eukprot:9785704-Alexandrium_andersonii.AAC.1